MYAKNRTNFIPYIYFYWSKYCAQYTIDKIFWNFRGCMGHSFCRFNIKYDIIFLWTKYTPIKYEKHILFILIYFITIVLTNLFLGVSNLDYYDILIFKILSLLVYLLLGYLLKIINFSKIKILISAFKRQL